MRSERTQIQLSGGASGLDIRHENRPMHSLTSVDCGAPYTKLACFRADVRSGKEELYRGLSKAVTVAVLFGFLHDSFRSKLAKQGQRGSESEGARLSIEEAVNSGS